MLWGSPIPEIPGRKTPWCHRQGSKRKRRIGWWLYIYYPIIWLYIQYTIMKENHIWFYYILWGYTIRYFMEITMEQITFQLGNPIDQPVYMYPTNIGGKTMTRGSCKGILYIFIWLYSITATYDHICLILYLSAQWRLPQLSLKLRVVFAKDALVTLLNGEADAMWVYADQAKNYQCSDGVTANWDCDLWVARQTMKLAAFIRFLMEWPVELVNWMICLWRMVMFHSYVNVYQRVSTGISCLAISFAGGDNLCN